MSELRGVFIPQFANHPLELRTVSNDWSSVKDTIGGYIEQISTPILRRLWLADGGDDHLVMLVDEEGSLKQRPMNMVASSLAGWMVVGDVFLVVNCPHSAQWASVPDEVWNALKPPALDESDDV